MRTDKRQATRCRTAADDTQMKQTYEYCWERLGVSVAGEIVGRLIVFSGAGLSAESGLSTFRGAGGLWNSHSIEQVCNVKTWRANYEAVHRFHNDRRAEISAAMPNKAHQFIAEWQRRYDTMIFTQNVDDLLERAGCTDVIHLHGHMQEMVCMACAHEWNIGSRAWSAGDRCQNPACQSQTDVKPNTVFFDEMAPNYRLFKRAFASLEGSDMVLVTGTSSKVIAVGRYLRHYPGYKVFNALEPSPTPEVYDESILLPATQAFPIVDKLLRNHLGGARLIRSRHPARIT